MTRDSENAPHQQPRCRPLYVCRRSVPERAPNATASSGRRSGEGRKSGSRVIRQVESNTPNSEWRIGAHRSASILGKFDLRQSPTSRSHEGYLFTRLQAGGIKTYHLTSKVIIRRVEWRHQVIIRESRCRPTRISNNHHSGRRRTVRARVFIRRRLSGASFPLVLAPSETYNLSHRARSRVRVWRGRLKERAYVLANPISDDMASGPEWVLSSGGS
jgi:hypothetical protein